MSDVYLINELASYGGAEVMVAQEKEQLEKLGLSVRLVTFDKSLDAFDYADHVNYKLSASPIMRIKNKLFPDIKIARDLADALKRDAPRLVHVHNQVDSLPTVLTAIDLFKKDGFGECLFVRTLHDYAMVCPRKWCVRPDMSPCEGCAVARCGKTCSLSMKDRLCLIQIKRFRNRTASAFDRLVAPSACLSRAATLNGLPTAVLRNPIRMKEGAGCSRRANSGSPFLYLGAISSRKGVAQLVEAWSKLSEGGFAGELLFAGPIEADLEGWFQAAIGKCDTIRYLGAVGHDDVPQLLDGAYCVVVPSLWLENYPTTALEALAANRMVIGSNRGGIPEIVTEKKCLFDPTDVSDIARTIEWCAHLPMRDYPEIVNQMRECLTVGGRNTWSRYFAHLCPDLLADIRIQENAR